MTIVRLAVLLIAALSAMPSAATERIGPSFDCTKAGFEPLALMICADPGLSKTDLRFAQAYQALKHYLDKDKRQQLAQEAVEFTASVLLSCGIPGAAGAPDCVAKHYNEQREIWLQPLRGPSREEAKRPIEDHIALQRQLQELLHLSAMKVDGVYGQDTRAAILDWQKKAGRATTGFIGDADAAALKLAATAGNEQASPTPAPSQPPSAQPSPTPAPSQPSGEQPSPVSAPSQPTGAGPSATPPPSQPGISTMASVALGIGIGIICGFVLAILIYAIFTKTFDAKVILAIGTPIAGASMVQGFFQKLVTDVANIVDTAYFLTSAVPAFVVMVVYPIVVFMARFGRDIGRASPRRVRRSREGH